MSVQFNQLEAQAQIHLRVPRGAAGDMTGGTQAVLEKIDGVETANVVSVDGVTPSAADLYVDVTAELDLAVDDDDPAAVEARLVDGFGIERVDTLALNYG